MKKEEASVLIIYTGGTIGMVESPTSKHLIPFDFENLTRQIPELNKIGVRLEGSSFAEPIDSSNMHPQVWSQIARLIGDRYDEFDGFVVLHGSDTLAYTASALSFMLEDLNKPVIITGAQLPIGVIRSDGKENLITSIEIAAAKKDGKAMVPEVAIFFEFQLYRGNRTHKVSAEQFEAFRSYNYPILANVGVHIKYNHWAIRAVNDKSLKVHEEMDTNLVVLHLFPGINQSTVSAILNAPNIKALILRTYGAGNAPTEDWFISLLEKAIEKGLVVLNITQCANGLVEQGKYETSSHLMDIGVIGGEDLTLEAAITKTMHLLAKHSDLEEVRAKLPVDLAGEINQF